MVLLKFFDRKIIIYIPRINHRKEKYFSEIRDKENVHKTRIKVFHKNLSQSFNKVRRSAT